MLQDFDHTLTLLQDFDQSLQDFDHTLTLYNICRWLRVLLIASCLLFGDIYDIFNHQQNRKMPENLGIYSSS